MVSPMLSMLINMIMIKTMTMIPKMVGSMLSMMTNMIMIRIMMMMASALLVMPPGDLVQGSLGSTDHRLQLKQGG